MYALTAQQQNSAKALAHFENTRVPFGVSKAENRYSSQKLRSEIDKKKNSLDRNP
jgi:hypothetical protein